MIGPLGLSTLRMMKKLLALGMVVAGLASAANAPLQPPDDRWLRGSAILDHPPAPAEPDPLAPFERRVDGDGKPSRLARRLVAGDRDSVRNYDKTRHHTSSHLTDSRIAELMIPAIE